MLRNESQKRGSKFILVLIISTLCKILMNEHRSFAAWEENVLKKVLERTPERAKEFVTDSGLPTERLALPETVDEKYLTKLGFPGQYPFTRGVRRRATRPKPYLRVAANRGHRLATRA